MSADETPPLHDVVFATTDSGDLLLDFYLPGNVDRPPLVVYIHGGGWQTHNRKNIRAAWLADHGFAVASISYRLSHEATFPAQIHDCKAAVRWLRAHADHYGYDAGRIAAVGTSAGAYLAMLLGVTAGVDELEGEVGCHSNQSSQVQAVVDYFGPSDFVLRATNQPERTDDPNGTVYRLLGGSVRGDLERAKLASPALHVSKDDPPLLILHGDADDVVLIDQAERMRDVYEQTGLPAAFVVVRGAGHSDEAFFQPPYRQPVVAFLHEHLSTPRE